MVGEREKRQRKAYAAQSRRACCAVRKELWLVPTRSRMAARWAGAAAWGARAGAGPQRTQAAVLQTGEQRPQVLLRLLEPHVRLVACQRRRVCVWGGGRGDTCVCQRVEAKARVNSCPTRRIICFLQSQQPVSLKLGQAGECSPGVQARRARRAPPVGGAGHSAAPPVRPPPAVVLMSSGRPSRSSSQSAIQRRSHLAMRSSTGMALSFNASAAAANASIRRCGATK
jgi:hypothetical protein